MNDDTALSLLRDLYNILEDGRVLDIERREDPPVPVIKFEHPHDLLNSINFGVHEPAEDPTALRALCENVVRYSVKTRHPHFYNQLYGGVDLFGLAGTWLSEALNTNQHTYEIAPVFILAEQAIIRHVLGVFGYQDGDGIFSPGGSIGNMYGMVLARYQRYPDVKNTGVFGLPPLVAFTSEEAHYSIQKGAHWLGFGTDNLVKVKTDEYGCMIVAELERKILETLENGKVPYFVNATVGTTVYGAIDPLEELAVICKKYNIWLHADACFGGTLILSKKYSQRLKGINLADSVVWNPHKTLGAPLQCTVFLTKHKGLLHKSNSAAASYLFQQDKFYDVSYDTGDKSVQCGRKVDAFKLWLMWKARGDLGFEKLVDNTMSCSEYLLSQVTKTTGFRLVIDRCQTTCVCFWYIPEAMRDQEENDDWYTRLGTVAPAIKKELILSGNLMVGYTPMPTKGICNFFRMVTSCQPPPSHSDMDFIVQEIEKYGSKITF